MSLIELGGLIFFFSCLVGMAYADHTELDLNAGEKLFIWGCAAGLALVFAGIVSNILKLAFGVH